MGITGLWDVLGKGEVHRIEDYAAAHWEKHKRPLRIAVDEACWRFSNLTDEQVQRIREGEPAANPIEKTILWRILKFWRLNIQLLFVTDGMRKPNKGRWGSGRGGGKLDDECIKMLHQMFDRLKVPYHQAPGEAEAECARLQQLGVVDAVWSDDGDCLMFGCTTMIKANRTSAGKKEWLERITVYQAETVLPRFNLDRDSLVCFAVLTGGDYDTAGLPNCGFQTARKLAQRHVGLAYELKMCQTAPDFARWRMLLASSLAAMHKAVAVPPNFPNVKALNGYRNPAISTDEQCFNLRGLRGGWEWLETQIDQPKLRIVLRDHYDFTTKEYLKHMGPVFLARALTRGVTPARREENLSYGIQLRRTLKRKGQDGEEGSVKSELNIKFNAWMLVDINLTSQDSVNADGSAYDPMKPIDGVMLKCFLDHGLPEGALDKPESPTKKKGKARSGMQEHDSASATPSASQSAPPSSAQTPSTSARKRSQDAPESEVVASQSKTAKKRRQTAEKRDYTDTAKKSRQRKPKAPAEEPPPPTFKRVDAPDFAALKRSCNVVDLDEEDTDDEIEIVSHPSQSTLSLKTSQGWQKTSRVPHWPSLDSPLRANTRGASAHEINFRIPADPFPSSSGTIDETVQDEASAAAMLRQRRERGLLSKLSSQTAASTRSEPPAPPRPPAPYEVIDLT